MYNLNFFIYQMLGVIADDLPFDAAADIRMRNTLRDRLPPFLSENEQAGMLDGSRYRMFVWVVWYFKEGGVVL